MTALNACLSFIDLHQMLLLVYNAFIDDLHKLHEAVGSTMVSSFYLCRKCWWEPIQIENTRRTSNNDFIIHLLKNFDLKCNINSRSGCLQNRICFEGIVKCSCVGHVAIKELVNKSLSFTRVFDVIHKSSWYFGRQFGPVEALAARCSTLDRVDCGWLRTLHLKYVGCDSRKFN